MRGFREDGRHAREFIQPHQRIPDVFQLVIIEIELLEADKRLKVGRIEGREEVLPETELLE